ncbi:TIGR01777 family oxidoreductase [Cyclobacterium qasimii]|uniref:Cell division inhibitor n=2 Tax=Cyclobacterium qasimii TaxID=1350429 RepID=S7WG64_9BACT|nr:TIGR01777 family oxidoreductase [Cyclobacterium qasimii]EPR65734.1 Cell division inhibitor [Cyclobacterium qasimii M12-11B]GEO23228.1 NAD-dependent epimerase [Cyclobacterium qasimii]
MQHILITGGSGLVGASITKRLEAIGKKVAWLSRNPDEHSQKSFFWDPKKGDIEEDAIEWADAVIHLAGAGVADKRWTEERKKVILDSRIDSSDLLYKALKKAKKKPQAIVCSSAVGYYGFDTGEKLVFEGDPAGDDFLADVVKKWEKATDKFQELNIRTVTFRIGIVLAKEGGALKEMLKPPVAAPLGSGHQYLSWIFIEDLSRMIEYALENHGVSGIYNAVGPVPVTNKVLTQRAAEYKGKPFVNIGVPSFALKLGLGEMANMVLGGNRVSNEKIEGTGFKFEYGDLNQALKKIFN